MLAACPLHAQTSLTGAGATFPYPMYSKWFNQYHKAHPDVEINYQSIGSGGGIRQVTEGTVDFGASDGPMNDKQIAEFKQKRGCDILHFPTVLGADVPTYNVPGISADLNFTPEALAGIFLGRITKWNDPEIQKANPSVKLPNNDLIVVHRSEASGTTYVWVDYLSKVSPEWKQKVGVGTAVNWPVGLGGKGNEGVSGQIKQTPYSIGYVELVYAIQNHLQYGQVRNQSGSFVKAGLASVTAAAAGAAENMPDDFRVSITNAPGRAAYPIASFTWLLIPSKIQDATKRKALVDFLRWMLTSGQNDTAALSYAQLPKQVVAKEQKAILKIQ
ncbi:MAG: phosphate ABC transporter substrate-binding protein PstS [Acidobacteriaceae bacterium]|nr:phosphate ABC transporter substrate-binding protein PstS [Acidobacteriaceae bacterium]